MDRPEIILAPGPTPIPPEVLLAQGSPLVYHRGPGFGNLMRDVTDAPEGAVPHRVRRRPADDLQRHAAGSSPRSRTASRPGDEVFVPLAGFFAERFKKLAETYGLTVRTIEYEWGTKIRPDDVARRARRAPREGGPAHPVRDLHRRDPADRGARAGRERRRRAGRSSTSCRRSAPCRSRSTTWGIDVAIGGSPEGAVGESRHRVRRRSANARGQATRDRHEPAVLLRLGAPTSGSPTCPHPENPWTPGDQRDAGPAGGACGCTSRTASTPRCAATGRCRRAVKEGAKALGLDLFGEGLEDNWTVTAIRAPEAADADAISDTIRADFGCVLAPGQGPLKGKVFRIGHFGYFSELDIIRGLAALEMTLETLGPPREARRGRRRRRDRVHGVAAVSRAGPRHRAALASRASICCARTSRSTCAPSSPPAGPRGRDRAVRRAHHPQRDAGHRRGARGRART